MGNYQCLFQTRKNDKLAEPSFKRQGRMGISADNVKNSLTYHLLRTSAPMANSGYSATPLFKKLGIKTGMQLWAWQMPRPYATFFELLPEKVDLLEHLDRVSKLDFVHLFVKSERELKEGWTTAIKFLKKDGILWVSWPKQSSSIATDIGKYEIMQYGLDQGLVDVKVAAIDEDWSGLKFMYRKTDR